MDDFLEKKPKKHSDAALATAARFSWAGLLALLDFANPKVPLSDITDIFLFWVLGIWVLGI